MILSDIMNNPIGRIIVSVVLGLGLASLFRKACGSKNCIVIKGPTIGEVEKYYYKIDDECYKYTPYASKCDA